jgi:flagellar hook-length control protein FliK
MYLDLPLVDDGQNARATTGSVASSTGDDSRFSSLLARQLSHGTKELATEEPGDIRSREANQDKEPAREPALEGRKELTGTKDAHGENKSGVAESSAGSLPSPLEQEVNPLLTGLNSWQSLAWPVTIQDPAGLLIAGAGGLSGTPETAVTIQSRLAGEIAARFSDQNGVQNLSLKLNPDHLGKVEVTLIAKGGQLSVQITAGNRDAEAALRENLRDLTDAIQHKNGRFQQVEVKVDLKSEDGSDQREADKQDRQSSGRNREGNGREDQTNHDPNRDPAEREFAAEPEIRNQEG